MTRYISILFAVLSCILGQLSFGATITFSASSIQVITEKPDASTGLNDIFVIFDTQGMSASYAASSNNVTWLRFSNLGGGYAEELAYERNGNVCTAQLGKDDVGYIIEDGNKRYYCWIVNYANHYARLDGLKFDSQQDCDRTRLALEGHAPKIHYYSITGQQKDLSRDLKVTYYTLEYDENTEEYGSKLAEVALAYAEGEFTVEAPLCDTEFTISGDRFLKQWKMEEQATSSTFHTNAVEAHTVATQDIRENENEQNVESEGLGGSAPIDINFHAAITDAVVFKEWQISKDSEFENVLDRYQQLDFDYTFRDQGTFYVRFMAADESGECEYFSDVYQVFVGESALLCPNAFSPGSSEGVNDEWKVSYKSIVSFQCHIFNRWGQEMKSFTNPADGWDGKYKGKYVPAGAYYYVIKAVGSDGKKYNLSGDINIIKSKSNGAATGDDTEVEPAEPTEE